MSKTLASLRTAVRTWVRERSAKTFTAPEVLLALNTIATKVHEIVARLPHAQYLTEVLDTVNLVAGTATYDWPADSVHYKTVEVYHSGAGEWVPLEELLPSQRVRGATVLGAAALPQYYIPRKSGIELRPTPSQSLTDGLRFVGSDEYTDMAAEDSTTGLPKLLDAPIEYGAASALLASDGDELATAFQAMYRSELKEALELLSRRTEAAQFMIDADE